MKVYLNRRYRFSASHRLYQESFSPEQNRAVYGKCSNPHGHGHNYVLEDTVSGQVATDTGMVCNLADLDEFVHRHVIEPLDHNDLNHAEAFKNTIPTTENLCTYLFGVLKNGFRHAVVEGVRVEETSSNSFEYAGGGEIRH